jgi:hypothetical protein
MLEMKKKRVEEKHFDALMMHLGLNYPFERKTPPAPDFIVIFQSQRVGVEHTRLHLPTEDGQPPLPDREKLNARIMESAQNHYQERGFPAVQADFNLGSIRVSKNAIKELGSRIAEAVAQNLPEVGNGIK